MKHLGANTTFMTRELAHRILLVLLTVFLAAETPACKKYPRKMSNAQLLKTIRNSDLSKSDEIEMRLLCWIEIRDRKPRELLEPVKQLLLDSSFMATVNDIEDAMAYYAEMKELGVPYLIEFSRSRDYTTSAEAIGRLEWCCRAPGIPDWKLDDTKNKDKAAAAWQKWYEENKQFLTVNKDGFVVVDEKKKTESGSK